MTSRRRRAAPPVRAGEPLGASPAPPTVGRMPLPPVGDLLAALHVVAIPMRVRFRGVTTREVALLEGPAGWGEFGPFLEYDAAEASRWLAAAVEAAWVGWPEPLRDSRAGQRDGARGRRRAAWPRCWRGSPGAPRPRSRWPSAASRWPTTSPGSPPCATCWAPSARVRVDANGGVVRRRRARGAGPRSAAYGLEYAEQPCATVEELRDLRISLARNGIDVLDRRRRVDPQGRGPAAGARPRGRRRRRGQGGAARGVRGRPRRSSRPAGCPWWCPRRSTRASASRPGWRSPPPCPTLDHACGLGTVALLAGDVAARPLRSGGRGAAGRPRWPSTPGGSSGSPRLPTAWRGGASGSPRPAPSCAGGPAGDRHPLGLAVPRHPAQRRGAVVGVLVRGHRLAAVAHPR